MIQKRSTSRAVILAGSRPHDGEVGGVVVLFEDLVRSPHASVEVFDTNPRNSGGTVLVVARFVAMCVRAAIQRREIALHGTAAQFKYLGAVLWAFRGVGLRYHLRKFAGGFHKYYEAQPSLVRALLDRVMCASEMNFFETRALVSYFADRNPRTYLMPNYRAHSSHRTGASFSGRFVFVGQARRSKGIDVLLALRGRLPHEWTIDVYGPLIDYAETEFGDGVCYRGVVTPDHVARVLAGYSALVLPTNHADEGYPGVIVEAFSVGLPVIATAIGGIPEIVTAVSGVLIEAEAEKLLEAMRVVATRYEALQEGSAAAFKPFERDAVLEFYWAAVGLEWSGSEREAR
jgi:glycosyltransferase involved in cell wall biosynthesis